MTSSSDNEEKVAPAEAPPPEAPIAAAEDVAARAPAAADPVHAEPAVAEFAVAAPTVAETAITEVAVVDPTAAVPDHAEPVVPAESAVAEPDATEAAVAEPVVAETAPAAEAEPAAPEPEAPVAPTIALIEPAHGPLAGCAVTIRGERFAEGCVVRFGETELATTREDDCTLRVDAPSAKASSYADVRVVNPDGQSEIRVHGFHYDAPPTLARIVPPIVSMARGGPISIFGAHFHNGLKLLIGTTDVFAIVDPDCIRALVPPAAEGLLDVTITNPDGQRAFAPGALRYSEGPVVTSVMPAEAPLEGGMEVTIVGRGFQPGCAVTFFDDYAPDVTFDDETCLRVIAPRRDEAGAGAVRVTNPDGLAHSVADAYLARVTPAPTLESISPSRAFVGGGARLTIVGEGFDPRCFVQLGEARGAVTFENAKLLHVVTPAVAAPAEVDVRVENPDGQSGVMAGGFTFTPIPTPPKLISITPARAFLAGGSTVTIAGDNFEEGIAVRIGEVRTTVRVVSRTLLEVYVPVHAEAGVVAVELIADGVVVRVEDIFHYESRPVPKITSVTPKNGPQNGGTRVTIEGENFHDSAYVRIGREAPKSVVSRKADQIVFITAPNRAGGMVDIEVGSDDGGADVMKNAFRYDVQAAPTISSVAPARGAVAGNTELSIDGKNFLADCVVLIGGKPAAKVKLLSATSIEVRTPAGQGGSMVDVVVRNPDGKEAVVKRAFLYDERYR